MHFKDIDKVSPAGIYFFFLFCYGLLMYNVYICMWHAQNKQAGSALNHRDRI